MGLVGSNGIFKHIKLFPTSFKEASLYSQNCSKVRECVHCHVIKNKIKNHSMDEVKKL